MTKPFVLALGPLLPPEMDQLEQEFEVLRLWKDPEPDKMLQAVSTQVQAILSTYNGPAVSARLMAALPNLEIVAQYAVGVDNIDLTEAAARQIAVTNTPGVLTDDTADLGLALLLAVARRVVEGDMFVRTGSWNGGELPLGRSLSGKAVGIVGLGRIGRAVARRCEAFGMAVSYHGPHKKGDVTYPYYADLTDLARAMDILILTCTGGPQTHRLVTRDVLEALGPQGILINIARGSVVDQNALVEALVNRRLGGAGLDVFAEEPQVPDELKSLDQVVLTPHIGSATLETQRKMGQLVIDNLKAHFTGAPLLTPVESQK